MAPPDQQIDLEGYVRPLTARDRSVTEAAPGEPPHLLRKLVAQSTELPSSCSSSMHRARMPAFVSGLTPLADDAERADHFGRNGSDFGFSCLLGGHGTDQTQDVRKRLWRGRWQSWQLCWRPLYLELTKRSGRARLFAFPPLAVREIRSIPP